MSILTHIQTDFPKAENYSLQNGVKLLKINELQGEAQLAAIRQTITEAGYSVYDDWQDHGSSFTTYTKGDEALYLTYQEKSSILRLITDSIKGLPPERQQGDANAADKASQGSQTAICTPLLTQGRPMYYAYDCGMQYIIRLTDGRFVVIDGGMNEYEETEHFLELLDQQNVTKDKPVVAAWFITHPHDDHFNLFSHVMTEHQDRLQLESLIYSWAAEDYSRPGSDLTDFNKAIEALDKDVKIIQPHTGQRFTYSGATFNILYTHEDACPDFLTNVNDTSIVMRMDLDEPAEAGNRRTMFFGDAMFGTAERLCDSYSAETLKCDLMQVAHHGYSGGSDRLYRTVDPAVILWPVPDYWYWTTSVLDCNYYLTHSEKTKAIFIGGRHEVTLDLSQSIGAIDPYEKHNNAQPGDVLYEEDFTGNRVYDLYWSAINTGYTDYVSAAITLQKGSCRLVAGEHHSMGELMQPGMLRKAQNWTLTLSGHAERVGMAALFWNYADPSEYNDEEALRLPLQRGEDFAIEFVVNGDTGKAILKNKGELIQELTFTPAKRRGLYFILQDADVTLTHIKVVKN